MDTIVPVSRRERFMLPWTAARMMVRGLVGRLCLLVSALAVLTCPSAVSAAPTNPHGLAVIIGNRSYTHADVPTVDYAHRDAQAFKRYVIDVLGYAPDNVIHIEDATRSEMQKVLGSAETTMNDIQARLNILAPQSGSDVVVYYSGHGVPGKSGDASLLPADVPPHRAQSESYPLKLLYEKLGALQHTKTVRVFLDACFSGSSDGGRLVAASPVYQEPAFPEEVTDTMMILTAVTGTQLATWDRKAGHGLFTHHLLDALYGEADTDADGQVTAREVERYLGRVVPSHAWLLNEREQRPQLTTRTQSGLVLASAGVGGGFPARPELSALSTAGEEEPKVADDGKDDAGASAQVKVEPAPSPAEVERALRLTHGQKELVQHGLEWLGHELGRVDGVLGPRSQAAIRAYQTEKGLAPTGQLTAQVSEALQVLGKRQMEKVRAAERRREEEARLKRERASREPGRRLRDCDGTWCPELVVVPAGSYMMGSPESEAGRNDDEGPRHRVTMAKPFAVGVTEVTRGEFGRFVRETGHSTGNACWTYEGGKWKERSGRNWRTPGYSQTDAHPVVCVSWEDAQAYVRWLTRETGERYRLLSESEWEYVARAGARTSRYWGDGESGQCAHANGGDRALKRRYGDWKWTTTSCDDGQIHTAPVGSYTKNGFGLHDVLGNVWEWVEDCWHASYEGAPGDGRAWTVRGDCVRRVLRGGAWLVGSAGPAFRGPQLVHSAGDRRRPRRFPSCQDVGLSPGSLLPCLLWGPGAKPLVEFLAWTGSGAGLGRRESRIVIRCRKCDGSGAVSCPGRGGCDTARSTLARATRRGARLETG